MKTGRVYFRIDNMFWSVRFMTAVTLARACAFDGIDYDLDKIGKRVKVRAAIRCQAYTPLDFSPFDWLECLRDMQEGAGLSPEPGSKEFQEFSNHGEGRPLRRKYE